MTRRLGIATIMLVALVVAACGKTPPSEPVAPSPTSPPVEVLPTPTAAPPTATPLPPTSTPEPPVAARVNGQIITVEAFQLELSRYEAAQYSLGRDPAAEGTLYQVQVLDALIEQLLIEQAATVEGVTVSDEALEAELQRLIEATGGEANFADWLEVSQYTAEEFRVVLRSGMINQAMYERVTALVSDVAEQVHARHIVVDSPEVGEAILAQLDGGADFATLAAEYSLDESTKLDGGDLGFFPRGLLLSPEVEAVAFSLSPGERSGLIQSDFGYHIVQVLERDPARPVSADVQQRLRTVAFERWLEQIWATATVERNI